MSLWDTSPTMIGPLRLKVQPADGWRWYVELVSADMLVTGDITRVTTQLAAGTEPTEGMARRAAVLAAARLLRQWLTAAEMDMGE